VRRSVFALALLVLVVAACGGSSKPVVRTVDVSQLTIEDVRARALVALSRPGLVFHTVQTASFNSGGQTYDYKREVWLDLERGLAREEERLNGELRGDEGRLRVFHDDHVAAVYSGRFSDAIFGPAPPPPTAALALDFLPTLFVERDVKSQKIEAATVDGKPAILVEVVAPAGGDFTGDETTRIFLDEQFLPIKKESRGPSGAGTVPYQNDFLARVSLPADLFSVDAVKAFVKTGADRMQEAVDAGFHPYWLGDPYTDLPLYDANVGAGSGGVQIFHLTYEANANGGGPEKPPYGLGMMEFSPKDWETWLGQSERWWQKPGVEKIPVDIASGKATIYRAPGQRGPEPASVFGEATPTPNATPAFNLQLVVEYADAALLIDPNIGPSNPYATVEGMTEIAQALRPFEAAR
jgi:hypothetical protein